jgi:hypothetical protein
MPICYPNAHNNNVSSIDRRMQLKLVINELFDVDYWDNYVYTLFRRKNTKIIPLQSIKIGLTWIIFSSFSRYIVNILVGEEHWRFHKGEVTAYTQNIWYFQKNIFI